MNSTILVPLDGSPASEWALPHAMAIARGTKARLRLATVDVPFVAMPYAMAGGSVAPERGPDTRGQISDYLEQTARRITQPYGIETEWEVLEGRIDRALLEHAAEVRAELIVLATHGRGPVHRAWLGSVADAVTRHALVPTLLIRPGGETPPELSEERAFRHILLALDGSELAEAILDKAAALGRIWDARYTLLRVVVPLYTFGPAYAATREHVDALLLREEVAGARAYLHHVVARMGEAGLSAEPVVITSRSPATGIIDYAAEARADLIATTTHGRGGIPRLVLGSVADKLIRASVAPVLVYRPPPR